MAATTPMKSFGKAKKNASEKKAPITFELCGEKLEARGSVPSLAVLDVVAAMQDEKNASAVLDYLAVAFDEANLTKFRRIANDPENELSTTEIYEVVGFLMEQQTGNPTQA